MKDLTGMSFTELHQYKAATYAERPFNEKHWDEVDRINQQLKTNDEEKK